MTSTRQSNDGRLLRSNGTRSLFDVSAVAPIPPQQERGVTTKTATLEVRAGKLAAIAEMKDKSFSEKKWWLRQKCKNMKAARRKIKATIDVRAESLLEDSMDAILKLSTKELQATWVFKLGSHSIVDRDRFEQEWFVLVMKELCEPQNGLWRNGCNISEKVSLQIDHRSGKKKVVNPPSMCSSVQYKDGIFYFRHVYNVLLFLFILISSKKFYMATT